MKIETARAISRLVDEMKGELGKDETLANLGRVRIENIVNLVCEEVRSAVEEVLGGERE